MKPQLKKKYGSRDHLRLVRSDDVAVPIHDPRIVLLDAEMHTAFVQLPGRVVSRGVQEIREKRQWPWRVLARREVEMHAAGIALEDVLRIHDTHRRWIVDVLYGVQRDRGWAA